MIRFGIRQKLGYSRVHCPNPDGIESQRQLQHHLDSTNEAGAFVSIYRLVVLRGLDVWRLRSFQSSIRTKTGYNQMKLQGPIDAVFGIFFLKMFL